MAEVASSETLRALDFPLFIEALAQLSQTSMGRGRLLALTPLDDPGQLEERHAEIDEFRQWQSQEGSLPLSGAEPLADVLARAAIEGTILDAGELLAVLSTARVARRVGDRLEEQEKKWPRTAAIASELPDLGRLIGQIERVLTDGGEVRDRASAEHSRLRRRRRRLRSKVLEALDQLVRSGPVAEALQERLVTQRSGRYVLPVRAGRRAALQGVVHDTSSSGQTLYVEPLQVLEQQNALSEVERAEEQEVQRLLAELTAHVRAAQAALAAAEQVIGALDALQAISRFAELTEAVAPQLIDGGLRLRASRHPLMIESFYQPPDGVAAAVGAGASSPAQELAEEGAGQPFVAEERLDFVPLDLELQPGQNVLVITGPNTGGKTVALKTVGILTVMAQCGLPVPASEARMHCCPRVHADIGDEQSIVANLSTFSAHLTRINSFLQECPPGSLVLLDELGTGTDPAEGAALGIALVERFDELGALTLVSTHHDALKSFAHGYPTAVNAAMEFDSVSLQPTYKLRLGLPGRSNAFEIASRLGLGQRLVARARSLMRMDREQLDSLLRSVEDEAQALAADREGLEQQRRQLQAAAERYRELNRGFDELRERLRREGQKAIREVVQEVRRAGEEMLAELSAEIGEEARARAAQDRRSRWAARATSAEAAATRALAGRLEELTRGGEASLPSLEEDAEAESLDQQVAVDPAEDAGRTLRRGEPVLVMPLKLRGRVSRDWDPAVDDPAAVEVDVRGKRLIVAREQVHRLVG